MSCCSISVGNGQEEGGIVANFSMQMTHLNLLGILGEYIGSTS